ncbi:SLC35A2 [Cordylochernes scorpioides]|uniref:SLC35A2 n=1 Tax=Cordylochernes scorpioides TaxID=51811 RepID=A0ABY6LR06_9ARAC|nr:SLC35A2 [Cordylochernes scorpioides]
MRFPAVAAASGSKCLKPILLGALCLCGATTDVLTAYTRRQPGPRYLASTAVLLTECSKLFAALTALLVLSGGSLPRLSTVLVTDGPREALRILVPASLYAVQNNLYYYALTNLDPATYTVTVQLKIFTTAVFMRTLLDVRITRGQWAALSVLFSGVCLVQLSPGLLPHRDPAGGSLAAGLSAMVVICIISGFSGVYFEKLLKHSTVPFWVRNLQMYVLGTMAAGVTCLGGDWAKIREQGFFLGYTHAVWALIALSAGSGITVSLVMRHLDNLHKTLGASVSIVMATGAMAILFHASPGPGFLAGAGLVMLAVFLYNYPLDRPTEHAELPR